MAWKGGFDGTPGKETVKGEAAECQQAYCQGKSEEANHPAFWMQRLQKSKETQEGDEIPGPEPGRADETIEQPARSHPADKLWQGIDTPRTQRKQAQYQVDESEEEHTGRMCEVFRR